MKQYNPGRWLGAYYTQMQYAASYLTPVNFFMLATNLWIASRPQIVQLAPWVSYPLVICVALVVMLVILPAFDFVVVQKSRMSYGNEQGWVHNSPIADSLTRIEKKLKKMDKKIDRISKS